MSEKVVCDHVEKCKIKYMIDCDHKEPHEKKVECDKICANHLESKCIPVDDQWKELFIRNLPHDIFNVAKYEYRFWDDPEDEHISKILKGIQDNGRAPFIAHYDSSFNHCEYRLIKINETFPLMKHDDVFKTWFFWLGNYIKVSEYSSDTKKYKLRDHWYTLDELNDWSKRYSVPPETDEGVEE